MTTLEDDFEFPCEECGTWHLHSQACTSTYRLEDYVYYKGVTVKPRHIDFPCSEEQLRSFCFDEDYDEDEYRR